MLKVSKLICENEKLFAYAKKFAPITFFIYALHSPVLSECVKKITLKVGMPSLIQFLLACIIDIGFSVLAALIFRKIFPSCFVILNGGKREK
ncbi:hypothetical protein [Treponema zioleckii]|uniref:hypothetical protein n=1 Tax=Treponema zioleckii TaxID=331680 RepID=UPI00168B3659|nr:hypothetical protein [Treponema zioleckii]